MIARVGVPTGVATWTDLVAGGAVVPGIVGWAGVVAAGVGGLNPGFGGVASPAGSAVGSWRLGTGMVYWFG
jgi:hypothetical protein